MKEELVEKYFDLLHPDFDSLSPEEQYKANMDKIFILGDIDNIDSYYKDCKTPGTFASKEGWSDNKIVKGAVTMSKADKYFRLLHPEYDSLSPEEQYRANMDKTLILSDMDNIDSYYKDCKTPGTFASKEGWSDNKIVKGAVTMSKADKYFRLLHPEYDSLSPEEQFGIGMDKVLILRNIDRIDSYYKDCKIPGTYASDQEWSDNEIVNVVVGKIKREKEKSVISQEEVEDCVSDTRAGKFQEASSTVRTVVKNEREHVNDENDKNADFEK